MVCEKLKEHYQIQYPSEKCIHISTVCVLPNMPMQYHESVLYIAPVYVLEQKDFSKLPPILLSIGYLSSDIYPAYAGKTALVQINSHKSCEKILWELMEILLMYQQWSERFLSAVIHHDGCDSYLRLIHEVIPNPMWIVDHNNCLIAYTADDPCGGEAGAAWNSTIENGYISLLGASSSDISYVDEQLIGAPEPVLIDISAASVPFLSTNIDIGQHRAALLTIMAYHREISQGDIDICKWLREILVIEFRYYKISNEYKDMRYEQLLNELLDGQITSEYYLQMRTENLSWKIRNYNFLALIPCQHIALSSNKLQSLRRHLLQSLPNSILTVYQGDLAALISQNRQKQLSVQTAKQLCSFLENYHLFAIISDCFSSLTDAQREYQNLLHAANHMNPSELRQNIYYYEDFKFYRIRTTLAEKAELSSYCCSGILHLLDYDHENGCSLADTLACYLKNNLSPTLTANELFIHRSTLQYRLQKIETITEMSLKNSNDVFEMNLSLRLLRTDE